MGFRPSRERDVLPRPWVRVAPFDGFLGFIGSGVEERFSKLFREVHDRRESAGDGVQVWTGRGKSRFEGRKCHLNANFTVF